MARLFPAPLYRGGRVVLIGAVSPAFVIGLTSARQLGRRGVRQGGVIGSREAARHENHDSG